MRTLAVLILFTVMASVAPGQEKAPQPPDQATKVYTSSADVLSLIAKAKKDRKDDQPSYAQPLLLLPPYKANMEYRAVVGGAAVHEREAELMYVMDGSGIITMGGKLVNEKRTNPDNLAGTAIEGGTAQPLAKGDFIIVPENTPHWFSTINGALILMTFHVPRTTGSPQH